MLPWHVILVMNGNSDMDPELGITDVPQLGRLFGGC